MGGITTAGKRNIGYGCHSTKLSGILVNSIATNRIRSGEEGGPLYRSLRVFGSRRAYGSRSVCWSRIVRQS